MNADSSRVNDNQLPTREYETEVKLRDGRTVLLRPIKPVDEPMWQEMFQCFSEESIRYRFFQVVQATPEMRKRYCNIDYSKEIAIVAELNEKGKKRILGVFRLILESDLKTGEIAFIIADEWQNLGLGKAMMRHMIRICRERHLELMYGIVLKSNIKGVRFMKNIGFTIQQLDEETIKATLDLKQEEKDRKNQKPTCIVLVFFSACVFRVAFVYVSICLLFSSIPKIALFMQNC